MTSTHQVKRANRIRRHARIRAKISGTAERPRISIFKANVHMYVQAIDDVASKTLAAVNDAHLHAKGAAKKGTKTERATAVGKALAELLKKAGITKAVFDVSGFKYHGRVSAVAEGLREGGIKI
jgi:large subunit ribosomal protein L18